MRSGTLAEPEYVRRFAFSSVPDDDIPSLAAIVDYLTVRRAALLEHLRSLSAADLLVKPSAEMPWTYEEWFQTLAWHEGHHHGQAHLTLNLYRATHDASVPKVGH